MIFKIFELHRVLHDITITIPIKNLIYIRRYSIQYSRKSTCPHINLPETEAKIIKRSKQRPQRPGSTSKKANLSASTDDSGEYRGGRKRDRGMVERERGGG